MPAGRPIEYSEDIEEEAWAYVNGDHEEDAIPSVVGLCKAINRARSTIYKWAEEDDKRFSDILEAIKEKQESVLIAKGLKGEFNSTITKLMLAKHGYHDKADNTLSGPGGGPVQQDHYWQVEFVNASSSD